MRRVAITERPDWREQAERYGFAFHTIDDAPYWDERAYYAFTLDEIEDDIEHASNEIHAMAMDLVADVVESEALLERLAIPDAFRDWIAQSWRRNDAHVYGRVDLAYDGRGAPKLYELNYDTPTALFEAAFFQWTWLEDLKRRGALPAGADQFNAIQEDLVEAFATIARELARPLAFAALRDCPEDEGTIAYLRDCARQAGLDSVALAIEDIGLTSDGRFVDLDDRAIGTLFKLYPLEALMTDEFGAALPRAELRLVEPPWKSILSNKGVLPLLWERHPDHPNLLPAYFDDDPRASLAPGWVRKPLLSREGANVELRWPDGRLERVGGPYGDGRFVRQALHALPRFDGGGYPLIGGWIVADRASGMGIREDDTPITRDTSRFVPHAIIG